VASKLADYAVEGKKPVVLLVNKYDLAGRIEPEEYRSYIDDRLKGLSFAPIVFISALTGFNVAAALEVARDLHRQANHRVTTGELNRAVSDLFNRRRPRAKGGRIPKIYYATQADVAPPTVVLFVSDPEAFSGNYLRYIENSLREAFPFPEVPLKIVLRRSGDRREEASSAGRETQQ